MFVINELFSDKTKVLLKGKQLNVSIYTYVLITVKERFEIFVQQKNDTSYLHRAMKAMFTAPQSTCQLNVRITQTLMGSPLMMYLQPQNYSN